MNTHYIKKEYIQKNIVRAIVRRKIYMKDVMIQIKQ